MGKTEGWDNSMYKAQNAVFKAWEKVFDKGVENGPAKPGADEFATEFRKLLDAAKKEAEAAVMLHTAKDSDLRTRLENFVKLLKVPAAVPAVVPGGAAMSAPSSVD